MRVKMIGFGLGRPADDVGRLATVPPPPAAGPPERTRGARWRRRPAWLLGLVLLVPVGLVPARSLASGADEPRPQAQAVQEYSGSFRGEAPGRRVWELTPAAREAVDGTRVRFEPAGLRITLPPGNPPTGQGSGVSAKLGVQGDFEITVSFEILHEPEPKETEIQTRVSLEVALDRHTGGRNMAALTRKVGAGGTQFTAWQVVRDDEAAPERQRAFGRPTAAKAGRLRLKRTASLLSYAVAEGADGEFTPLCEFPFAADDLREVRLAASTGGPKASYDVLLTDLHIRAQALPGLAEAAAPTPQPTPQTAPAKGKGWLAASVVCGLALVLGLAVWLAARRDRRTEPLPVTVPEETGPAGAGPAEALAFTCPGCGKALKAREALAGKKVKCPQCGQGVAVPEIKAGEAGSASA